MVVGGIMTYCKTCEIYQKMDVRNQKMKLMTIEYKHKTTHSWVVGKICWTTVVWKVHNDVFRHVSIVWSLAFCICNFDDCASGTIEESLSGIEVLVA